MPNNIFVANRKKIQNAFIQSEFLKPLTEDDIPYLLVEKENKEGDGNLRMVNLLNLPVTDEVRPISYVIDMELSNNLFSSSENQKKVEKVFLVLSDNTMFVILVEMKSSLQRKTITHIEGKIKDSLSRLSLFLPNYIFDGPLFDNYEIKYHCLVIYNGNFVQRDIDQDPTLAKNDVVRILLGRQHTFNAKDVFGDTYKMNVIFKQNTTGNPEQIDIDMNDIFEENPEFVYATHSEKTLP